MDLDRFHELHEWRDKAKALAYRWCRRRFPKASHQRAWKFATLAWMRFLRKKPVKRTELKRPAGVELLPDDTSLPV